MFAYFGPLRHFWMTPATDVEAEQTVRRCGRRRRPASLRQISTDPPAEDRATQPGTARAVRPWRFAGAFIPPYC